jgi:hypothetical protein
LDTEIIPRRQAAKNNRAGSLSGTVVIGGIAYTFQRIQLFDGEASAVVPESFAEMIPEAAKLKYPSEHRPQYILASEDGTVNLAFSMLDFPLAKNQTEEKLGELKEAIKRINPAFVVLTESTETLDGRKVGFFDYKSYAFDQDIYNFMFITDVEGKLLLGVFNCPYDGYGDWKRLVTQMAMSIKEGNDNDGCG